MKNKLFLTVLAAWLLSALPMYGQRDKGFAGFLKTGYTCVPGSGNAFEKISPIAITGYSDHYFLFGADAYYQTGKLMIGLDGYLGAQRSRSAGNQHADPYAGAGHLKLGYIVKQTQHYWIYPSFGTGSAFLVLSDYTRQDDRPRNIHNSTMFSPSFDLGINADLILAPNPENREKFGAFLMGLRAGYRASFSNSKWYDEHGDRLTVSPAYSNHGFYVGVALGGGWFRRNSW